MPAICFSSFCPLLSQSTVETSLHVFEESANRPLIGAHVSLTPILKSEWRLPASFSTTDSKGKVTFELQQPVFVEISHIGLKSFFDTLKPGISNRVYLQISETDVEEVVITGQYVPVIAGQSTQKIRILTKDQISQRGSVNLRDALSSELNLNLEEDLTLGSRLSMNGIGGEI